MAQFFAGSRIACRCTFKNKTAKMTAHLVLGKFSCKISIEVDNM